MAEEILFEHETAQSRADVAAYLRTIADKLDAGETLTLQAGGQELTVEIPATLDFEVKAERETGEGPDELSVEFELEWTEGAGEEAGLDIS